MLLVATLLIPLVVSLVLYLLPAYLARQKRIDNPTEIYVASRPTSEGVSSNAAIAYALQMATFGPFFVWGASGDYWPPILNSIFFGLGVWLIIYFRKPIVEFLTISMRGHASITLHGFLATAHGNARSVRVIASILTVIALWGIVIAEMFGVTSVVAPILNGNKEAAFVVVATMFLFMFLYTTTGGNDGVQRTDQFQLGVSYLSIFILLTLLLVRVANIDASRSVILPVLLGGILLAVLLWRRRLKFLDYHARSIADDDLTQNSLMVKAARIYSALERLLNFSVVTAVVLGLAGCGFLLLRTGIEPKVILGALAPLRTTQSSVVAMIALALLPFAYQICDLSNWQRLAALRPDMLGKDDESEAERTVLGAMRSYAIEGPTTWIILVVLGAIAGAAFQIGDKADPVGSFVSALMSSGALGLVMLLFLVLAASAIALSTMDAVLSATLYAFRYDIVFDRKADSKFDKAESRRVRIVNTFGIATYTIVVLGLYIAQSYDIGFGSGQYMTILLAVYSAQISFLPLIVGGIMGRRTPEGFWNAGRNGAIATLVAGFAIAIFATFQSMRSGNADLGWGAIPMCLGASAGVYLIACGIRRIFTPRSGEAR